MNAAIRAVTRRAISCGAELFGIRHGYAGLIASDFFPLGARDAGGIMHLGSPRSAKSTDENEYNNPEHGRREYILKPPLRKALAKPNTGRRPYRADGHKDIVDLEQVASGGPDRSGGSSPCSTCLGINVPLHVSRA